MLTLESPLVHLSPWLRPGRGLRLRPPLQALQSAVRTELTRRWNYRRDGLIRTSYDFLAFADVLAAGVSDRRHVAKVVVCNETVLDRIHGANTHGHKAQAKRI
jgi:hypothetical protein